MPEGITLLLVLAILGAIVAIVLAHEKPPSEVGRAAGGWLPSARRARRLAEDAAYEKWQREGGGAWFDSWWDSPEAAGSHAKEAAAARPEAPGRLSTEEARRKLNALLALTVARGATPAEAATARAIAQRLKADYDLP